MRRSTVGLFDEIRNSKFSIFFDFFDFFIILKNPETHNDFEDVGMLRKQSFEFFELAFLSTMIVDIIFKIGWDEMR